MSNGRFDRMRLTFHQGDSLFVYPCHEMAAVACPQMQLVDRHAGNSKERTTP